MKKILLSMLLLASLVSCVKTEQPGTNVNVDDSLPVFEAKMSNGTLVTTKSFNEKVGLIVFFNTNCNDCKKELPSLQKIWDKYKENLVFCPISREEGEASVAEYWKSNSLTMPYSAQESRDLYSKFASSGIPLMYVVKNGKIIKIWTDSTLPSFDEMDSYLGKLYITIDFDE